MLLEPTCSAEYDHPAGRRPARHAAAARSFCACLAIAYRYYSAFLAAKVAALDDSPPDAGPRFNDGQNYHPTNKWVLFGHHFAAISGAGPLIGPVLAIQYGYMPGLLWLVIGVCLAGAVQDMLVLAASVRRGGKSLAEIARAELGSLAGGDRLGGHSVHRRHRPGRTWLRRRQGARRRGSQPWPNGIEIHLPAGRGSQAIDRPADDALSGPCRHARIYLSQRPGDVSRTFRGDSTS